MKKIFDVLLGLSFFAFTIWLWMSSRDSSMGNTALVLLILFILMFFLYMKHSGMVILNMCTMFISMLLWSSPLRSIVTMVSDSGNMTTDIFGFAVILFAFGLAFRRKLKDS